jgi:hypothetical protein
MLESIIDTALHEYSREMEIEVEFTNDAEEPDIPNAEDGAEA